MEQQGKVVRPNWDNQNKDVCGIMNYYVDREHVELLLLRQEIQIENTCNYCIVCEKCKKFLLIRKNIKKWGFGHLTRTLEFGKFTIQIGHIKQYF